MKIPEIERYPLNATFELTARCNLKCKMCLIRIDHNQMAELGGRERTTEEWIGMAREIQEAGAIGLLLTGGEPLLRPDFIDIYQSIAKMGFMLTLYTNATLVTPEIMEVLSKYPPHRIGITVYGASPDTYDRVTGNPDAYFRMLQGVHLLSRLPSKITIRTTLIKDNLDDLDSITQWAISLSPDVDFNVSRIVTKPVRGCTTDVDSCRLTPEQNVSMLRKRNTDYVLKPFQKLLNERPEIIEKQYKGNQDTKEQYCKDLKPTLYGCDAGMSSYTITWDGKLIGCQMLGDCCTYPFEDGFMQAWENFPTKVKLPSMPELCNGCNVNCSACPATRLAETGYLNGIPEYLCKESRLAKDMEAKMIAELKQIIAKGEE